MTLLLGRWFTLAVLAGGLVVAPAEAAGQFTYTGCAIGSSSAFRACSSAEVTYNAATGTLVINVINLNESTGWNMEDYTSETGGWHTIRAIGLDNLTYAVGGEGLSLAMFYDADGDGRLEAIDPLYWSLDAASLQIDNTSASSDEGHLQGIVGGWDPGPAGKQHLQTTGGRYVQFSISGFANLDLTAESIVNWQSVQVAEEDCTPSDPDGFTGEEDCLTGNSLKGAAVVPEPITMLLLGTGLMGVGGVGLVRRRRGTDLVDE